MRFLFKTSYNQDIRIFRDKVDGAWYGLLAVAVLGGFGSIPGALVGGIIIGLIELFAGRFLPDGFKDAAPYVVLLLILAVRPQGLFGTLARKKV